MAELARLGAFDAFRIALDAVQVEPADAAARFSFRGSAAAAAAAGRGFGVTLPQAACRAETAGQRVALWLGPDEWLLLAPEGSAEAVARSMAEALGETPHSLVDIGHRLAGLALAGPRAAVVINNFCPLDLDPAAFPVGMCTRTVFAKAEIGLWRAEQNRFRVEVARSFAGYLRGLIEEACREFSR
jgi:sarcosine oxidase subunit gamma